MATDLIPTAFDAYARAWAGYATASVADNTARAIAYGVAKALAYFGDRRIDTITAHDCRAYAVALRNHPHQPGTVRHLVTLLRRVLDAAIADGLIVRNPAAGLARPFTRLRGKGLPFPTEQLAAVDTALRQHHPVVADLLTFALRTCCRPGEACGLQWDDLDLDAGTARIQRGWSYRLHPTTKGRRARTVALDADVTAMLRARHRDELRHPVWVFPSPRRYHQPVSRSYVAKVLRDTVTACGLDTGNGRTPHALRHAGATILTEAGVDLRWLQQQLGHASVQITHDLYARTAQLQPPADLAAIFRRAQRRPPLPSPISERSRPGRRRA